MSKSIADQIQRIQRRIDQLGDPSEIKERRASRRIERGQGTWEDFELFAPEVRSEYQQEIMIELPDALVRSIHGWPIKHSDPGLLAVLQVVVVPPTSDLSMEQEALLYGIDHGWTTHQDWDDKVLWAVTRMTYFDADGQSLRDRCWDVEGGRPRLSQEVLALAHSTRFSAPAILEILQSEPAKLILEELIEEAGSKHLSTQRTILKERGFRNYLDVSCLDAAVLLDNSADLWWLGDAEHVAFLGQNWSEVVTLGATATRDYAVQRSLAWVVTALEQDAIWRDEWRNDAWHASRLAEKSGWPVESEFLLAKSRGTPMSLADVEALIATRSSSET